MSTWVTLVDGYDVDTLQHQQSLMVQHAVKMRGVSSSHLRQVIADFVGQSNCLKALHQNETVLLISYQSNAALLM